MLGNLFPPQEIHAHNLSKVLSLTTQTQFSLKGFSWNTLSSAFRVLRSPLSIPVTTRLQEKRKSIPPVYKNTTTLHSTQKPIITQSFNLTRKAFNGRMYAVQYASQKIWWHPEGFNRISLMARGGKGHISIDWADTIAFMSCWGQYWLLIGCQLRFNWGPGVKIDRPINDVMTSRSLQPIDIEQGPHKPEKNATISQELYEDAPNPWTVWKLLAFWLGISPFFLAE